MTRAGWRGGPGFVLLTLTLVNTVNWADRQVVPILVPAIKADLALTDTQLGLVGGLAFSLIYALSAFLFGFLADRSSRRRVILFGLVCWSVATAAGAFAHDFWSLFAARFVTGIGEASLYPCAMSLLTDAFPTERQGNAIGMFGASTAVGSGLGIGLGGPLVAHLGWRSVFLLYGGAGLLVLPLLLMMEEPARSGSEVALAHDPPVSIIRGALGDVRLLAVWLTGTLLIAAATGWITWAPTYFVRDLQFDVGSVAGIFGIAQLFGGVAGSIAGGRLGDRYRKRRVAGQLSVAALASLAAVPLFGVALLDVPHPLLMTCAVLGPFAIFAAFPSLQSQVAEIVPARRRGLVFAVHVFFLSGIGAALGPFLVGFLSDRTGSLRAALLAPLLGVLLASLSAMFAARVVRARTPS
ncbi:MAG TPA: MFS transporter [Candidatus Binatia bacterium]|jgi:MFS family permease